MSIDDNFYMQLAIDEAWRYQLLTFPNPAVGCTIVKNGEILAIEAHKKANTPHAEINAIKAAFLKKYDCQILKNMQTSAEIHEYFSKLQTNFFEDCEFFVTLEPCNHFGKTPPCALLLEKLKPKRIIIASLDPNKNASGGAQRLKNANIEVCSCCLENEAKKLLYPFDLLVTNKGLKLFKIATRLNGSFDGGRITSQKTIEYLHEIRSLTEAIAIGGNTVRLDKPILDARFSKSKKAPNIVIFSKQESFDRQIPLFGIKNRVVKIEKNFEALDNYRFVMVEGGTNLLNLVYNNVNLFLFVISSQKVGGSSFLSGLQIEFELLRAVNFGSELLVWLKKKDI